MSVFVSTTFAANESSVLDAIEILKDASILNIELGSIHKNEDDLLSKLKSRGCNFITHNFFPPVSDRMILNIASTDEHIRQGSINYIKKAIDFAVGVNACIYTIHPGFVIDPAGEGFNERNYDFDFSVPSNASSEKWFKCFNLFIKSLNDIANYVQDKAITIAIETQGAVCNKDVVIFSKPEDYESYFNENLTKKFGINLNLAHLDLASRAWNFDKYEVIEMLKPSIVAIEVSHNEGDFDSHQALKSDGWYMEVLKDDFFKDKHVIFEGRNIPVTEVISSFTLLKQILE